MFAMAGVSAVAVAVTATACGAEDGQSGSGGVTASPAANTQLTVVVKDSPKSAAKTWTLICEPPGGSHPDASDACAAVTKNPDVLKPTPTDQACTQIYGGPRVATVSGVWRGRPVNTKFSALNGCEIARWTKAGALLGEA